MSDNRLTTRHAANVVPLRAADWHAPQCDCEVCDPPHPADPPRNLTANEIALLVLSGFGVGEAICFVIDKIVGGPGIFSVIGL